MRIWFKSRFGVGNARSNSGALRTFGLVLVAVVVVVVTGQAAFGDASAKAALQPKFSANAAAYIPATVNGQPVVFDPRSEHRVREPFCEVGPDGLTVVPLVASSDDFVSEVAAGGWTCIGGTSLGSSFTAGLEAANVKPKVPSMSSASLATKDGGADAGSVKSLSVTVAKGLTVKVYTWTLTTPLPGATQPTTFLLASAEPRKHLLLSVATPLGATTSALQNLTVMLQTGAGVPGTTRALPT